MVTETVHGPGWVKVEEAYVLISQHAGQCGFHGTRVKARRQTASALEREYEVSREDTWTEENWFHPTSGFRILRYTPYAEVEDRSCEVYDAGGRYVDNYSIYGEYIFPHEGKVLLEAGLIIPRSCECGAISELRLGKVVREEPEECWDAESAEAASGTRMWEEDCWIAQCSSCGKEEEDVLEPQADFPKWYLFLQHAPWSKRVAKSLSPKKETW